MIKYHRRVEKFRGDDSLYGLDSIPAGETLVVCGLTKEDFALLGYSEKAYSDRDMELGGEKVNCPACLLLELDYHD